MFYSTVCFIALAIYCATLTVVCLGEIKDIRRSLSAHSDLISHYSPICGKNMDMIQDIQSEVRKADEVFSDLWDRIDAHENKIHDISVALTSIEAALYNHSILIDRNKYEIQNIKANIEK